MEEQNIAHVFTQNIARFRKRRGLSQYDLARVTGISRRMISHYESDGAIPPGDRLQALASALETSISKLFEDHTGKTEPVADLTDIDPRSIKKFRDILSLPPRPGPAAAGRTLPIQGRGFPSCAA
jgi:transcriptional regulator with XRE-family HTH domain